MYDFSVKAWTTSAAMSSPSPVVKMLPTAVGRWHLVLLLLLHSCTGLDNGLARTPAMGYNTWNAFGLNITEDLIRNAADLLVSSGLAELGYTYLNLDDAWSNKSRNSQGSLVADPDRFPSGIPSLAEYVHSKGLKFGIYSDAGYLTCGGYPGSLEHEEQDAALFASYGVDYLKYDNCYAPPPEQMPVRDRYARMLAALNATGKPILYSMCEWGVSHPYQYGAQMGNSWRVSNDIDNTWPTVMRSLDACVGMARHAGPGGWNDPDMLEKREHKFPGPHADNMGTAWWGMPKLGLDEERAHFALWALLKAPLLIGADLRSIAPESLAILKAQEVIALNQDRLGVPGDLIYKEGHNEVWAAPLAGGSRGVILFNRHDGFDKYPADSLTVQWTHLGLPADCQAMVRELYSGRELGVFSGSFSAVVPVHDVAVLKITPLRVRAQYDEWRPWHNGGILTTPDPPGTALSGNTEVGGRTGLLVGGFAAGALLAAVVGYYVLRRQQALLASYGRLPDDTLGQPAAVDITVSKLSPFKGSAARQPAP